MKFAQASSNIKTGHLKAPVVEMDGNKERVFEEMFASALRREPGSVIDYWCRYPKHEFLSYLVERKDVLLHGSNESNIKFLVPIRVSTSDVWWEQMEAVYAFSDGILPIIYAILDRNEYKGCLKDDCFWAPDEKGVATKYYYFSLNIQALVKRVWRDGTVYIVDRKPFERLKDDDGNYLEEWVSREAAQVLAKVRVSPSDFPFLTKVLIHTENAAQRERPTVEVAPRVYDSYVGRYELASGVILTVTKESDGLYVQAMRYRPFKLYPASETEYFIKQADLSLTFVKNTFGPVMQAIVNMDDQTLTAKRVY